LGCNRAISVELNTTSVENASSGGSGDERLLASIRLGDMQALSSIPPLCRYHPLNWSTDSEANSKANASSNPVAEVAVAGVVEDAGGNGGWEIRDNSAESRNPAI
jgi:hypothetical protein